ncbi:tetratricopeptide repeat protein [Flavobacteriaceae bacterium GSB9]|nr:tetratricopeptide repeat protein [Flavobacteriaceae bacterium GSB9]
MKTFLFIVLLLISTPVKGQTYALNKHLIDRDKNDFLGCKKEVFDFKVQLSFSVGTSDLTSSITAIKDEEPKNDEYLEKLKDSLSKDSLNFKLLYKIGKFYDKIGAENNSKAYYKEALEHINIKFFDSDSASFYGTRSLLKAKLGIKKGFIEDAEKALLLNPNEYHSLFTYPMYLASKGEYEKAKTILTNSLTNNTLYPELGIFLLITINTTKYLEEFKQLDDNPSLKQKLKQKHYKTLIDWSSIRNHYEKLNHKQAAINLDKLLNFYNLFFRCGFFDLDENGQILFDFSRDEKKDLKALERWLKQSLKHKTLNAYTAYKHLGLINFYLEDDDKAIDYYQKAIDIFSRNKTKLIAEPNDAYLTLLSIYKFLDKKTEYENLLLRKISDPRARTFSDYINLSKFYILEDDIEKVRFYIEEAEKIDSKNFDIYRLKAHASYMENTKIIMENYYLSKAFRTTKNEQDAYKLILQWAIYDMFNNHPRLAYGKLITIKNKIKKGDCETCDRLITTYFNIEN